MTDNQIIRIPYKYGELINTMDNAECWKLMKALFAKKPDDLTGLNLTYYNIIIVDINNIENQVKKWQESGKLWWRPKANKTPGVIKSETPPFWKTKPKLSKDKIREDKISKDNNTNIIITNNNKLFNNINKENILNKYKITETELQDEIENFKNYWKAIVRKWKKEDIWKELWETKNTFSINGRFATWLWNNNKWQKNNLSFKPHWIWIVE